MLPVLIGTIIVVPITILGLAVCVLAAYLALIPDCKITIGNRHADS